MSRQLLKYGFLPENKCAFFLCDLQENFRKAVIYFDNIVDSANKLVKTSKILNIPLVVTEQYPKGLGRTVQELDISHAVGVYPKTRFSMLEPQVVNHLGSLCSSQLECVVLFGIEAHVCIEQTAAELSARGIQVHVVADACSSRSQEDRLLAFQRLKQIGCFITTTENVIFKLIKDKEHPKFGDVRLLIKTPTPETGLMYFSKM
ncbi:isochorismatase domain-containing protein 1-like [Bacillus rossius redtenbacheri]|uniref:isochorismatase domain-containing protein 1-like n=1 Tax=Bacillus rossius redtenbacheri TaxID=93214 RepID=UPI002FDECFB6